MLLKSIALTAIVVLFSHPVQSSFNPKPAISEMGYQRSAWLLAETNAKKRRDNRQDDRGRSDNREDRRDCRDEDGVAGRDKRDCKQHARKGMDKKDDDGNG